jgi:hypothetical protein
MATFCRRIFNWPNVRLSKTGISVAISFEAMSRIVKEPFAPPRHVIKTRASSLGWWQAFLAIVNLILQRAIVVNHGVNSSNGLYAQSRQKDIDR